MSFFFPLPDPPNKKRKSFFDIESAQPQAPMNLLDLAQARQQMTAARYPTLQGEPSAEFQAAAARNAGTFKDILQTAKNQFSLKDPENYRPEDMAADAAVGSVPVVGGIQSLRDAVRSFRQGKVGWGIFNTLLAPLDFVGGGALTAMAVPMIRKLGAHSDDIDRIVAAAVKIDGQIYTGPNHGRALESYAKEQGLIREGMKDSEIADVLDNLFETKKVEDGYAMKSGRMVSREEATKLGEANGQLQKRPGRTELQSYELEDEFKSGPKLVVDEPVAPPAAATAPKLLGSGAAAPGAEAREKIAQRFQAMGGTQDEMGQWQLPPESREKVRQEVLSGLEDDQRRRMTPKMLDEVVDLYVRAPDPRTLASLIVAGGKGAQWYDPVAETLVNMFGNEAPRFAGLLAAMSPQAEVQQNLVYALKAFEEWKKNPLDTSDEAIERIIGASGNMLKDAVRDNLKTVFRATDDQLTDLPSLLGIGTEGSKNEGKLFLSGGKVDAFWSNLMGETNRLVQDTHQAQSAGTTENAISTLGHNAALSAAFRNAIKVIEQDLGIKIDPRQAQAAYWTAVKAMRDSMKGARGKAATSGMTKKMKEAVAKGLHPMDTPMMAPSTQGRVRTFQSELDSQKAQAVMQALGVQTPAPVQLPPNPFDALTPAQIRQYVRPEDVIDITSRNDAVKLKNYTGDVPIRMKPRPRGVGEGILVSTNPKKLPFKAPPKALWGAAGLGLLGGAARPEDEENNPLRGLLF